jgi:hypothetical protein
MTLFFAEHLNKLTLVFFCLFVSSIFLLAGDVSFPLHSELRLQHLNQQLVQDDLPVVADLEPEPSQDGIGLESIL